MDDNDNRLFGITAQIAWAPKPSYQLTLRTPLYAIRNQRVSCRRSGRSRGLRIPHGRAAQQLADFRLAGSAIGAGLQAAADILDAGRALFDFGRDLVLSDTEARADDRPDILAGIQPL